MSGFWRNFLTLLLALSRRDSTVLQVGCFCNFWVTPFDVGIRTLKSDKYLQLVEAAQLDFGVRSGLLKRLRKLGCAMVNVEQQIQFKKPIKLFDKVCVQTTLIHADDKFVRFEHAFTVRGVTCAIAVVQAKFKTGRITQSAVELTGFNKLAPQDADEKPQASY